MRLTAQEIYDKLINEDQILTLQGQIRFNLGDVSIVVRQKDVIGNIMQEWLQGWLDAKGIEYAPSENTQMPPDFFLNPDDKTRNLLEVKAFNRNATPGFDIADFRMYQKEIIDKPYMLDVEYLIFGYDMDENGIVVIRDVWMKKVWEITRRMEGWPLNLQIKEGHVHKIRPGVWYSERTVDYPMFESLEHFISAVEECVYKNPETRSEAATWKTRFLSNYRSRNGVTLDIPRWCDISEDYNYKRIRQIEQAQNNVEKAQERLDAAQSKLDEVNVSLTIALNDGNTARIDALRTEKGKLENRIADLLEKYMKANEKLQSLQI
jgi:type II restriction enzyme